MNLIVLVILICFFIFLYFLYLISKDDFVISRKDIQMDKIFNLAILTGIISLLSSRVFFTFFNPKPQLLSILGFLAFPYFPGLSLIGGIIGGSLFLYFYSRFRKMPVGKILDLFSMSLIGVLPFGFLGTFFILLGVTSILFNWMFVFSFLILILFLKIIYPLSVKGEIRDGSLSLIFMLIFSFLYFLTKLFLNIKYFSFLDVENITILLTFFVSLILLINQEIVEKILNKK